MTGPRLTCPAVTLDRCLVMHSLRHFQPTSLGHLLLTTTSRSRWQQWQHPPLRTGRALATQSPHASAPAEQPQQHAHDLSVTLLVNENVRRQTGRLLLHREQLVQAVELLAAADYALLVIAPAAAGGGSSNGSNGSSGSGGSDGSSGSGSSISVLYANTAAYQALQPSSAAAIAMVDNRKQQQQQQQQPSNCHTVLAHHMQALPQPLVDILQQLWHHQQQRLQQESNTAATACQSHPGQQQQQQQQQQQVAPAQQGSVVLQGISWRLNQYDAAISTHGSLQQQERQQSEHHHQQQQQQQQQQHIQPGSSCMAQQPELLLIEELLVVPVVSPNDAPFGLALLFDHWSYSNSAVGVPGWPHVMPAELPTSQQLQWAADAVRQQADAVRALKMAQGLGNKDVAVVEAVADLQARKQHLARLEGLQAAFQSDKLRPLQDILGAVAQPASSHK